MVTKPNTPMPLGPTGMKPHPTKIEPAKQVSGFGSKAGIDKADPANADKTGDNKFTLPEKVTQQEIRDGSFKYGGGRSAGNRSQLDNNVRKAVEP